MGRMGPMGLMGGSVGQQAGEGGHVGDGDDCDGRRVGGLWLQGCVAVGDAGGVVWGRRGLNVDDEEA